MPGPRRGHSAEFGVMLPVPPSTSCPVSQGVGGPTPLPCDQGQQHCPFLTLTGPGEDPSCRSRGHQAPPAPSRSRAVPPAVPGAAGVGRGGAEEELQALELPHVPAHAVVQHGGQEAAG